MLRAAIICPDVELGFQLEARLSAISGVQIVRLANDYPNEDDLARLLRSQVPEVIFLGTENLAEATRVVASASSLLEGIQLVTVGRRADPNALLELMRGGVREFVSHPFEDGHLIESLVRIKDILEKKPVKAETTDKVFGFLPAKPGCGATTIAVNTAVAISRISDNPTLLIDSDRVSGIVRFLLQLTNEYSVQDAIERALQLDDNIWPQLVSKLGSLEVIHSGSMRPDQDQDASTPVYLIDYARRYYDHVFLDFAGFFDKSEIEALRECKIIFLTVTPEIPSLHLAKEKINFLGKIGLKDRIEIVVNRHPKRPTLQLHTIGEILSRPVHTHFGNHYQEVMRALTAAKPVDARSELGQEFARFARALLGRKVVNMEQKRKMTDLFSLLPGTLSLLPQTKKPAN